MSNQNTAQARRLATVARLYDLQLEEARAELVLAQRRASERKQVAAEIQSRVEDANQLASAQLERSSGVSADLLRQARSYSRSQESALNEQQERVRQAEDAATSAVAEVTRRYQALSAVERLLERRRQDAALDAEQAAQKSLDDHALVRTAHASNET
jgi:flagellar biosynthesis chaperone FliJ